MDVAPCQQDLHGYSSSWLLEVEFCWASWLGCYSGLLGHCRKIYFATKVMINFSFLQAGWAHTCASSVQNILFSQALLSLPRALCSVCADRHHQGFQSSEPGCKEHRPFCVVPDAFLSSVLAFAQHSWYSSACPQSNSCLFQGTKWAWGNNFSVRGIVLHCLIPPWSSVKLQPAGLSWNMLSA